MQQVGRYRLTRRLGQGGMAEVFEAVAEGEGGFRRRVAIKQVLPQLARDLSIARMFLDEARTTSHLHHGNIVSVLDYGTADGAAFQVLEYVDGLDLDGLLRRADERRHPLPVGLAIYIVLQVANALDYAHHAGDETGASLGIVHRDVSPSNVLVSWDGHLKLSDFGIALSATRLERTEGTGVKGKLEYMSPEQVMRGNVDKRSDVFALGCMLQRIITGKSPLAELSALTRMASGEELELDPALDEKVREIIARATRHAQTQRYPSAGELARALAAILPSYLAGEPSFALKQWLLPLRDDALPEKKRGALDALLNVELLLTPSDANTQERTFATHAKAPSVESLLAPSAPALTSPANVTQLVGQAEKVPARRTWIWASATLLFVSGALAFAWIAQGTRDSSVAMAPPLPAPKRDAAPPVELAANDAATLGNEDLAEPAPQEPPARSERKKPRTRVSAKSSAVSSPTPAAPLPAASTPAGPGTLVIGGDGALRAEIRVDGRSLGFAPKRIELSAGSHEVVLVRPDGTRIGPRNVLIETHHTQSAPAKWIVN